MESVNITIDLYEFDELSKDAQDKAVSEHWEFIIDEHDGIMDFEEVAQNIRVNEYYFYKDGELTHTVKYNNPGKEFFIFQDKEYLIK